MKKKKRKRRNGCESVSRYNATDCAKQIHTHTHIHTYVHLKRYDTFLWWRAFTDA